MIFFRFVNVVLYSRFDKALIWSQIKTLRLQYLKKNIYLKCDKNFIRKEKIVDNFEKLSQLIKANISSDKIDENFSDSDLNVSAEMFMFLNSCPSFLTRLYWNTIYGPESRITMLASNIIKKVNDDFKIRALEIFTNISQVVGFQHINYQYKQNKSVGNNIEKNIDMNVSDKKLLQRVNTHPVHIMNNEGDLSPSSFIPFCSFGQKFIGAKVKGFEIKVCNIFEPKIFNDQLCYETDLDKLKDSNKKILDEQLEMGLTLVLDYNEERQANYNEFSNETEKSLYYHDNSVSIFLDTISIKLQARLDLDILSF